MKWYSFKQYLIFLTISSLNVMNVFSQKPVKNYEKEWQKVEILAEKGLPKSALQEVKKIYALAKREKQDAQIIKSLMYMVRLQTENRESNEALSIKEVEKEITTSSEPVTSILKSLLAEMYWNYYQNYRWQIYDRTPIKDFSGSDITTWTAEDFHKKISDLYLQSIRQEKLLQQTNLSPFNAIIVKGNVRHLRPTLFDLLVHRALTYFQNNERDIKKPAYAFEINQPEAFNPANDFIKHKFVTKDTLSLQHKALLLYQKILEFHLNDSNPDALIDADLLRIQFVKNNSTHPDKDKLYYNAVSHIANQYGNTPAAAQAWYLLAAYHHEKANEYKPYDDTTYRFERLKAKEICERILLQKDSSEGKINCFNLLNEINKKSFHFSIEKVNIPNQPFRYLVNYKKINKLYFRIIKADENIKKQLENHYEEKFWTTLITAKAERSWEQNLPDPDDLQPHSVEIKIDALPGGEYILLASDSKNFDSPECILGARLFYVSAISYVNNGNDYFVLNRNNGKPLAKANVQVWEQRYDYSTSKYIKEKATTYITDTNGFFRMDIKKKSGIYGYYNYLLEITHNNDSLFMNDPVYDYYFHNQENEESETITSIHLFTDRSIYRPGQTVFFKGIVLARNTKDKTCAVKPNYSATVILRDANYTDIDSVKLKTNEFGSFSGKFQLPPGGLNGQFSIYTKTDNGNTRFRVEEYKRPKFYVDFEPVKGTYKVNDRIKITGFAKAYAGNNIDGATVNYRVVRQPRFIYPWIFWRWWEPQSDEMEIAHGEVKTDKDGKFVVEFTAIPDVKIDKKFEPVFDYTVYADVTDINGETRSGEKTVSVSYKSLMLVCNVPSSLPADSLKQISIRTQNINGEYEPAIVKVAISKLKEEKRLIRKRYWERPDQFVMSKEEYIKNFPHDEYDNESDYKSWSKEEQVFSHTDSSRADGSWPILNSSWKPGIYSVEITAKAKNGDEVNDIKFIELFDEKSTQLNIPAYLWTGTMRTTIEPGDIAKVELGTAADDLFIVHQVNRESPSSKPQNVNYKFLNLSNKIETFSFTATEQDRGGYSVGWMFIKHNRLYQFNQTINVPWTNKDLTIEYATYRNKTLPGSEEKWKVKIIGYKKEKVAAEMLAGMYDASLDQFYNHDWSRPSIWPSYYNRTAWNGSQNFTHLQSQHKYEMDRQIKYVDKRYDYLITQAEIYSWVKIAYTKWSRPAAPSPIQELSETVIEFDAYDMAPEMSDTTKVKIEKKKSTQQDPSVKIRKNFNETAFFFPDLKTDSTGAIEFSFTMPEALTKWKFMALAHTKDAAFGLSTREIITQKELMVQPNVPRFLREGDKIEFSSKVVNLTDKEITGIAELRLFDAETNMPVDGWFKNSIPDQYFTVAAGQSELVKFPVEVPHQFNKAIVWRIVAKVFAFADEPGWSDGEENLMPVLTNRVLVTETMPLTMRERGSKNFRFEKLLSSSKNESLQHYALTVEYTSNPAWYAVQALPYLMEYPYDCAEQIWNRYYANSVAARIVNSSPKIKQVFENLKIKDTTALLSNLEKNRELKAVLLEETPWVLQAKNETEQKRNIALLFDMVRMSQQLNSSYDKLKQMQSSNGGFVWFTGGPDDRYMTQYIVTGIGHLMKLNAVAKGQADKLKAILQRAIPYLDKKIKEDYDELIKNKTNLKTYTPGYTIIQYLYMRSFFPNYQIAPASRKAYDYFLDRVKHTWVPQNKYMQGMIALALFRKGDTQTSKAILQSLKETSITHEEFGMYWREQRPGWFWYEAPLETHALLIEAFMEAGKDNKTVDDLRTWLLKKKQTNHWKTTKATAEACYALLLQGNDWLNNEPVVEIKLGNVTIKSNETTQESGTGYFKKTIEGSKVQSQMGNISVKVEDTPRIPPKGRVTTWGGIYWQYFEDLDKITAASTPMKLSKKLFLEKNSDRGPTLIPVNDGDVLNVGSKIKVRIELRIDRDMEYVHMKDMRASGLEPVNVLSQYKWQGGLGYYETTKDASTNFFFNYLRKGTYVFEYPLCVTHAGNFSNGITTIQCMYAPQFSSHSEGIRIIVE